VIEGVWWGRATVRERRKGGRCGVRRGEVWPGCLYRCRGVGRRPGNGEVRVAPLMAVRVGYRKRGRRPIKEG
jgi:hypothetical protein